MSNVIKKLNVYLTYPHAHSSSVVRRLRMEIGNRVCTSLSNQGHEVINIPLLMTVMEDPKSLPYAFMKHCEEMHVVKLPGWKGCKRIKMELDYFENKLKRNVVYHDN